MKVAVSRKERFCAVHRLYNPKWSDEQNFLVFGKCANPNFHGHNYEVIVTVFGEPDIETGYVYDMKALSTLISQEITSRFDHKNLNLDTSFFKDKIPTAENIVIVIWQLLREKIQNSLELKVTLYETEKNFVEYPA